MYIKLEVGDADSSNQLFIPRHCYNLSSGSRAFCFSVPRIWNSLHVRIRVCQSLPAFKRHLKTQFFNLAYSTPSDPFYNFGAIHIFYLHNHFSAVASPSP